ncbi:MAG: host-nuclease inhibitor Gam family protein [Chitinophagaceae bacterium]|nr:host-nuclease inhibitor Gam family protein [Chitinophagaceae bacterium]
MTRVSKKLITEVNRETAEEAFADYNRATAQLQIIEGKMNAEITTVKEKHEPKINSLQEQKDECFELMQVYAESNPELFGNKKSVEWTHGKFGFRTGTPKLQTRKGFKWPAVLELVKEKLTGYVRVKEDLDKEKLLANRNDIDLKAVGVEVVQDESFFMEPNLEMVSTN